MNNATDSRYHRQTLIPGWDQRALTSARVMVVGAGALGCEVLKNLALSGIGHITIVDFDAVELSNLSRCALYRDSDLGRNKAIAAAERLRDLNPQITATALARNIEHDLGAGALRGYDLVLGAVDTISARLGIDRLCRQARLPWIDGGMDATGGQVSLFNAQSGPCYQCGMTESMWARVAQRHGCLALGAGIEQPTVRLAATVTMASSIAAIQAQEAIRYLLRNARNPASAIENAHPALQNDAPAMRPGDRICLQTAPYAMYTLHSRKNPECDCASSASLGASFSNNQTNRHFDRSHRAFCDGGAEKPAVTAERTTGVPGERSLFGDVESETTRTTRVPFTTASTAAELLQATEAETLTLPWDIVTALDCFGCSHEHTSTPLFRLRAAHLACPTCGRTRTPEMQSRIHVTDKVANHTLAQLGFPAQSHIELTRPSGETFTIELADQVFAEQVFAEQGLAEEIQAGQTPAERNAQIHSPAEVHA